MNEVSFSKLCGFILIPFLAIFSVWWIVGEDFNNFLITLLNSIFSSILIALGIATLCSWWFSLSRKSNVKISISLSLILIVIIVALGYIQSFESIQPPGLYTPLAIFLNNLLESITIFMSLGFVALIGMLVSNEIGTPEEE